MATNRRLTTYAFIDASNLMYGGRKSLGWSVDHDKLLGYLKDKYHVVQAHYYAGVELGGYKFDIVKQDVIDLSQLKKHLEANLEESQAKHKKIGTIKFFQKLEKFGYILHLKPVKTFKTGRKITKKANCDVDMTFDIMRLSNKFSRIIALTGDGDFFSVLKYQKVKCKKKLFILSRSERTAKELKSLVGSEFRDFHYLREIVRLK